jgi:hypothetical protein
MAALWGKKLRFCGVFGKQRFRERLWSFNPGLLPSLVRHKILKSGDLPLSKAEPR